MRILKHTLCALSAAAALSLPFTTHASQHDSAAKAASAELVDGEVRKVDKEQGKVTLKHGEIKSIGMSPMTMVFRVKDAAILDRLAPGDKIRFQVERVDGALTVTHAEKAQ